MNLRKMRGGGDPIVKTLNFDSKKIVEITIRDNNVFRKKGFTITFTFNVDNFRTGLFGTDNEKTGPLLDFMCALLPNELSPKTTTLEDASRTISKVLSGTNLHYLAKYDNLKDASKTNDKASGECAYAISLSTNKSVYESVANGLTINKQFLDKSGNVKPEYTDCKVVMEFTEDKDKQESSRLQISSIDYIEHTSTTCNRTKVQRCNRNNGPVKNWITDEKPTLHFSISVDNLKTKILDEILSDNVEQTSASQFSLLKKPIEEVMRDRPLTESVVVDSQPQPSAPATAPAPARSNWPPAPSRSIDITDDDDNPHSPWNK